MIVSWSGLPRQVPSGGQWPAAPRPGSELSCSESRVTATHWQLSHWHLKSWYPMNDMSPYDIIVCSLISHYKPWYHTISQTGMLLGRRGVVAATRSMRMGERWRGMLVLSQDAWYGFLINHCNPSLMPGQTDRRRGRAGPAFDSNRIAFELAQGQRIWTCGSPSPFYFTFRVRLGVSTARTRIWAGLNQWRYHTYDIICTWHL